MMIYPSINPVAFALGPIKVHWYGLMYVFGFFCAWALAKYRVKKHKLSWSKEQVADIIFYAAIGVVIGGRLGYVLFYDFSNFAANPLNIFKIWQGGMSFHGGLLGVMVGLWFVAKKMHITYFQLTDFVAPLVPIGLGAGRIGNFINGELWGRPTTVPWAIVYPQVDWQPRHPSEIYEFLLEGVLLFIILWLYSAKPKPEKSVSGLFLIGYGSFRFFVEFFRQPDSQLGFIAFKWMTMGQLLCIPMVAFGILLCVLAYRSQSREEPSCNNT